MGSFEEEELVEMVRDFIESESPSLTSSSKALSCTHQPTYLTLQELLWRVTEAEAVVVEKVLMYLRNMGSAGEPENNLKKWVVMRLKMDGFEASLCKTSWVTTFGRPAGDYEYIDVMMKDGNHGGKPTRLIVDIDFRSQFELARPTPTYKELTNTLPSIFVGTEEKLNKIISLLCSAAKQSLTDKGLHIPPWRKASYMQSKWLSEDCKRVSAEVSLNTEVVVSIDGDEAKNSGSASCSTNFDKWAPPIVKPKRRVVGGGSGLSSQFSKMGINCC